jgi:glutamyl-tRNA reductase
VSILVVSVSHKTAPVEFLSQLAMLPAAAAKFSDDVMGSDHVDEVVVLSTCNRTELYASISRFHGGLDDCAEALARFADVSVGELQRRCAVYFDEGAVAHTFSVAAGLDSLVVGESQILGQVKAALTASQAHGTVGSVLNSLFQQAIRVGKRVQSETGVGSAGRSLVTAAYDLLADRLGPLADRRLLVVGAGSMATLAARTAAAAGARVFCANRTYARAIRLADSVSGTAVPWAELPAAVAGSDLVVTCTGARDLILTPLDLRGTRVRGVVDLALPADVAEEVRDLGIELVNLARLMAERHEIGTARDVEAARELVRSEVSDFLGVRRAATVAPTVVALRSMASEVMTAELDRLDARLPDLAPKIREEVHHAVRRVVDKLLHAPTVRVQELAADSASVDYAAALRELFALDPQTVAAVMAPEVPR